MAFAVRSRASLCALRCAMHTTSAISVRRISVPFCSFRNLCNSPTTHTPNTTLGSKSQTTSASSLSQFAPLSAQSTAEDVKRIVEFLDENYNFVDRAELFAWFNKAFAAKLESQPLAHVLTALSLATREDHELGEMVLGSNLVAEFIHPLLRDKNPASISCVAAACDVLTSLLDTNDPIVSADLLLRSENNELGLAFSIFELSQTANNPTLSAAALNLLSAAANTDASAVAASLQLESVLRFLGNDVLVGASTLPIVRAALSVLRQLSLFEPIAAKMNENIFNMVIRAVRANATDWEVVDHAFAFLAHMRNSVYKEDTIRIGVLTELDFMLTIIDAMQNHSNDAWLLAQGFQFVLAVDPDEPGLGRVGKYHANVIRSLMKTHSTVADVQAYGCLAAEVIARHHPKVFTKTGMLEQCDMIHDIFYNDVFVRNCASYLAHSLRKTTRGTGHNYTSIPPEWDHTAGGPGTMLKFEGGGKTTYLGGHPKKFTDELKQAFAAEAQARGDKSVEFLEEPFSDDEFGAEIDLDAGTTDDDVPDLQLEDRDPQNLIADELARRQLEEFRMMAEAANGSSAAAKEVAEAAKFPFPQYEHPANVMWFQGAIDALHADEAAKEMEITNQDMQKVKDAIKQWEKETGQRWNANADKDASADPDINVWREDGVMEVVERELLNMAIEEEAAAAAAKSAAPSGGDAAAESATAPQVEESGNDADDEGSSDNTNTNTQQDAGNNENNTNTTTPKE